MSGATDAKGLRERLTTGTEDRLGRALSDLLENPILTGAIGRAFDARERAVQAQELAMGALNLPSAADIERLTRRLRSLSQRLEGIEDGVDRLDRTLAARMAPGAPSAPAVSRASPGVDARLGAIEKKLDTLTKAVGQMQEPAPDRRARTPRAAPSPSPKTTPKRRAPAKASAAKRKG